MIQLKKYLRISPVCQVLFLEVGERKQTWTLPWRKSHLRVGRQTWVQINDQAGGRATVGARFIGCEVTGRSSVGAGNQEWHRGGTND